MFADFFRKSQPPVQEHPRDPEAERLLREFDVEQGNTLDTRDPSTLERLKKNYDLIREKISFSFEDFIDIIDTYEIKDTVIETARQLFQYIEHPVSKTLFLLMLLSIPGHEAEYEDPADLADAFANSETYDGIASEETLDTDMPEPVRRKRFESEKKPLPLIELGRVPAGRDFVRAMETAARHKPWEQMKHKPGVDAEYEWKRQTILQWNRMINKGRVELLRRKYDAKSFHDPQVERELNGWLMGPVGQETLAILKEICTGKNGNPGPEYISHFLGVIIMESDGNPNLVQSKAEDAAIGLGQAKPSVASEDVHIIGNWHDPAEREKLKDPRTNLTFLKKFWWDTYHEERHRQFKYANNNAFNVGEGQMISILKEYGEDPTGLNMGHVSDFHDVLDRMTFVRLYNAMKTREFYSITTKKRVSYADSADYALGINILSDYFSRRLGSVAQPRKERAPRTVAEAPEPTPILEQPAPRAPQKIDRPSQTSKSKISLLPHNRMRKK